MARRERELTTIGTVATYDFVRTVTGEGASTKAAVSTLAAAIVENYSGTSLGGTNRSIKSAVDAISSDVSAIETTVSVIETTVEIDQEVKDLYESLGWNE